MNDPTPETLLDVCTEAAQTAGMHALNNLDRREETVEQFDHDVKLVMDRECQTVAEQIIHNRFLDHAILGEEGSVEKAHEFEWIVDPIDGTANYTRGLPTWCCSVAVRRKEKILAGCVFVPMLKECFTAADGEPARCNGNPIGLSKTQQLSQATFFAGLTKDIDRRALDFFCDMAPRVNKIRMIGSAAIDICNIACGRSDGYYEAGIYLWDVAAAGLIAECAGAKITQWSRDEPLGIRYLCTVPSIHEDIKQIAEQHFS